MISRGQRSFQVFNIVLLTVIGLTMVLPILHVIAESLSNSIAINSSKVYFWPVNATTANYQSILKDPSIWVAFKNSLIITIFGTLINLAATASLAYPLSRQEYMGRKIILIMVLITLVFHAPLIPNYLLLKQLKLINTLWVLMIPTAIGTFNLFVMRSFFMNLPSELIDSARIDGCGEMRILRSIVLPLSKPAMATMGILYAVANWNTYSAGIYYISSRSMIPLQVRLREMIITDQFGAADSALDSALSLSPEGMKMAVIVVATIPIMMVYPFLQKHFIKGLLVGSVKS